MVDAHCFHTRALRGPHRPPGPGSVGAGGAGFDGTPGERDMPERSLLPAPGAPPAPGAARGCDVAGWVAGATSPVSTTLAAKRRTTGSGSDSANFDATC